MLSPPCHAERSEASNTGFLAALGMTNKVCMDSSLSLGMTNKVFGITKKVRKTSVFVQSNDKNTQNIWNIYFLRCAIHTGFLAFARNDKKVRGMTKKEMPRMTEQKASLKIIFPHRVA